MTDKFRKDSAVDADNRRYIPIWRDVLTNLLRYPPEAVDEFVEYWISDEILCHETAIYYLFPCLIPKELQERLSRNEWWELGNRIENALTTSSEQTARPGEDGYDWVAARQRVNAILSEYGCGLP
jgi:hypothetical protein